MDVIGISSGARLRCAATNFTEEVGEKKGKGEKKTN